jgi:hypothetical protein
MNLQTPGDFDRRTWKGSLSSVVVSWKMIRVLRRVPSVAVVLAWLLVSPLAMAGGDSTVAAIRELASNQDFRVRTQAALALGSSEDPKAVEPLCRALDDPKAAVRAAVAAALGKLSMGGLDCLEQREAKESTDSVKVAIEKAITAVRASGGEASECVIDSKTRFYISIGKTSDNTQRKKSRVPELIRSALAKAILRQKGFCIGPDGESKAAYQKRISGRKQIRGLLLAPKIQAAEYQDDAVTVRFEVAILTFPEKALKGMVPVKLTQQGSVKKSEQAEDELFRMAVERAVEKLLKNIERIE